MIPDRTIWAVVTRHGLAGTYARRDDAIRKQRALHGSLSAEVQAVTLDDDVEHLRRGAELWDVAVWADGSATATASKENGPQPWKPDTGLRGRGERATVWAKGKAEALRMGQGAGVR